MTVSGGPITAVKVVSDSELQENGGDYVVAGRVARRVYLFSTEQRPVAGGAVLPVYYVSQAQLDAGDFRLQGNTALEPIIVVAGRPVQGNTAIPVFVAEQE